MMKKLIPIFTISITAGIIVSAYYGRKKWLINQLIDLWKKEAEKKEIKIDPKLLTKELTKLNVFELELFRKYSKTFIKMDRKEQQKMMELFNKVTKKGGITDKGNFSSLEGIVFGT